MARGYQGIEINKKTQRIFKNFLDLELFQFEIYSLFPKIFIGSSSTCIYIMFERKPLHDKWITGSFSSSSRRC